MTTPSPPTSLRRRSRSFSRRDSAVRLGGRLEGCARRRSTPPSIRRSPRPVTPPRRAPSLRVFAATNWCSANSAVSHLAASCLPQRVAMRRASGSPCTTAICGACARAGTRQRQSPTMREQPGRQVALSRASAHLSTCRFSCPLTFPSTSRFTSWSRETRVGCHRLSALPPWSGTGATPTTHQEHGSSFRRRARCGRRGGVSPS